MKAKVPQDLCRGTLMPGAAGPRMPGPAMTGFAGNFLRGRPYKLIH